MIHVCFSLYDKNGTYSKFTGTTILSLFENTSAPVTVHILHDKTLTDDNRKKFIYIAGRYDQAIKFYNVEKLCPEKIAEIVELTPDVKNARVSVGAFYRLLTPVFFPSEIEKIIYLDSDIVVNLDIKELWKVELGEKILAAVPEILSYGSIEAMKNWFQMCKHGFVKCEDYFNSGVLIMDLKLLRREEKNILDGIRFRAQNPECCDYFDQNVLNYCFSTRILKLPVKFNTYTQAVRLYDEPLAKKIYHYAGGSLGYGLTLDMNDALNRLWMKYFVKTPWFNEETIARLYEKFFQLQAELKKSAMNLLSAMNGKRRTFITMEEGIKILVENFSVRNDEEIILVKPGTPIQKIVDAMNTSRGEKIFFFLIPNFPFKMLEEAGFVQRKDFADCFEFLPDNYDSYPLVKAM